MIEVIENVKFSTVLPETAHQIAKAFSGQQHLPEKAEQVYRNALAVYAGQRFLEHLGFETELEKSDSWDTIMQTLLDTADLNVKNIGKLECRPVSPNSTTVSIPMEVLENRIGYVAVELNDSLTMATLLGFAETVETEELPVNQLRSLTILIDQLTSLQQPEANKTPVQLHQWLKHIFEPEWQVVQTLLNPETRNLAYLPREAQLSISRAKKLDLKMLLRDQAVILLVSLTPQLDDKMEIHVQLHPSKTARHLPPNLKLALVSAAGRVITEVESSHQDYCIQLHRFKYKTGRSFQIQVTLNDTSITQELFAV